MWSGGRNVLCAHDGQVVHSKFSSRSEILDFRVLSDVKVCSGLRAGHIRLRMIACQVAGVTRILAENGLRDGQFPLRRGEHTRRTDLLRA